MEEPPTVKSRRKAGRGNLSIRQRQKSGSVGVGPAHQLGLPPVSRQLATHLDPRPSPVHKRLVQCSAHDVRRKACSALWGPLASLLLFTMPAGVSWSNYLKMLSATMLTMLAGAEVVHRYYRPDLTIPENPPKPGELRTELLGLKERQDEVQISQQR
uniref:Uncharacterized protein n=1 Tax=Ornithorhynchus anatinus TaxID=9258 RepID=A0A6I8N3P2_ORNAN